LSKRITIKSASDGKKFELSWPEPHESFTNYVKVWVIGLSCDVSADVDLHMSEPLPRFFQSLANSWRGWEGEKKWASLEEELKLSASIDHTGHVKLRIQLKSGHYAYDWRLETAVQLEAGQLEALAQEMTQFFASGRYIDHSKPVK
jgi:hypothetical protein